MRHSEPNLAALQEQQVLLDLAGISDTSTRRSIAALALALASAGEDDGGRPRDPPDETDILDAFRRIDDATTRDSVLRLIRSLAESEV